MLLSLSSVEFVPKAEAGWVLTLYYYLYKVSSSFAFLIPSLARQFSGGWIYPCGENIVSTWILISLERWNLSLSWKYCLYMNTAFPGEVKFFRVQNIGVTSMLLSLGRWNLSPSWKYWVLTRILSLGGEISQGIIFYRVNYPTEYINTPFSGEVKSL